MLRFDNASEKHPVAGGDEQRAYDGERQGKRIRTYSFARQLVAWAK